MPVLHGGGSIQTLVAKFYSLAYTTLVLLALALFCTLEASCLVMWDH